METTERLDANDGKEVPAHPYLVRQMSDLGFRQNPEGSNTGVRAEISSLPIYALAR